jgi:hypothetical protein
VLFAVTSVVLVAQARKLAEWADAGPAVHDIAHRRREP